MSAGLQDRVIQTYGGLVFMDFTKKNATSTNEYVSLDPQLLPALYLAYSTHAGKKLESNFITVERII